MAEVKEVVKKLLVGRVPGMDELRPKMLNVLNAVGLSWLTPLFSTTWRTGKMHVKWQTRMVVPFLKKGGPESVLHLAWGHTSYSTQESLAQGVGREAPNNC